MSHNVKKFFMAVLVILVSGTMASRVYAAAAGDSAATPANTQIFNGYWDGTGAAVAPGEMTIQIGNVFAGLLATETRDTLAVDSVYAFSSLESLQIGDQTAGNYDTVYYQYIIQNYGNVLSDSFGVLINIVDTTNASDHFPVSDLDVVTDTAGADNVVSWATGGGAVDSIYYGLNLAEGALDTFFIRIVVPKIDSAADGDSINIAIRIRDQRDAGTHDYWPDTLGGAYSTAARVVVDTFGTYLFTDSVGNAANCLLDFGDTQYDTVTLSIAAATIRLAKSVTKIGWTYAKPKPGDTLQYTIKYDNDGTGATVDDAYIVDNLPLGVSFIDTVSLEGGNGSHPTMELYHKGSGGNAWISHIPGTQDSLLRVTALRFTVPSGLNAQAGDNASASVADDSTGADAGMIKFQVRVR